MLFRTLLLLGITSLSSTTSDESEVAADTKQPLSEMQYAVPAEMPYQVALQTRKPIVVLCGGAILNEHYVITSANCVVTVHAMPITMKNLRIIIKVPKDQSFYRSKHNIESIICHNNLTEKNWFDMDIALIKVKTPFKLSPYVAFVKLPERGEVVNPGATAFISTIGMLARRFENTVKRIATNIVSKDYCQEKYKIYNITIRNDQLCANNTHFQQQNCGDSGGPLTINGKLVGIFSVGLGCFYPDVPVIYTRVSSYIDWIRKYAFE